MSRRYRVVLVSTVSWKDLHVAWLAEHPEEAENEAIARAPNAGNLTSQLLNWEHGFAGEQTIYCDRPCFHRLRALWEFVHAHPAEVKVSYGHDRLLEALCRGQMYSHEYACMTCARDVRSLGAVYPINLWGQRREGDPRHPEWGLQSVQVMEPYMSITYLSEEGFNRWSEYGYYDARWRGEGEVPGPSQSALWPIRLRRVAEEPPIPFCKCKRVGRHPIGWTDPTATEPSQRMDEVLAYGDPPKFRPPRPPPAPAQPAPGGSTWRTYP